MTRLLAIIAIVAAGLAAIDPLAERWLEVDAARRSVDRRVETFRHVVFRNMEETQRSVNAAISRAYRRLEALPDEKEPLELRVVLIGNSAGLFAIAPAEVERRLAAAYPTRRVRLRALLIPDIGVRDERLLVRGGPREVAGSDRAPAEPEGAHPGTRGSDALRAGALRCSRGSAAPRAPGGGAPPAPRPALAALPSARRAAGSRGRRRCGSPAWRRAQRRAPRDPGGLCRDRGDGEPSGRGRAARRLPRPRARTIHPGGDAEQAGSPGRPDLPRHAPDCWGRASGRGAGGSRSSCRSIPCSAIPRPPGASRRCASTTTPCVVSRRSPSRSTPAPGSPPPISSTRFPLLRSSTSFTPTPRECGPSRRRWRRWRSRRSSWRPRCRRSVRRHRDTLAPWPSPRSPVSRNTAAGPSMSSYGSTCRTSRSGRS